MLSFLKKFDVISKSQLVKKKGKSTNVALTTLIDKMYNALDQKLPSICTFIDLARAFDTV